jgi:hypothetical protein
MHHRMPQLFDDAMMEHPSPRQSAHDDQCVAGFVPIKIKTRSGIRWIIACRNHSMMR